MFEEGIYFIIMMLWGIAITLLIALAEAGIVYGLSAYKNKISFVKLWLFGLFTGMIFWTIVSYRECYVHPVQMKLPLLMVLVVLSISIGTFSYLLVRIKRSNQADH